MKPKTRPHKYASSPTYVKPSMSLNLAISGQLSPRATPDDGHPMRLREVPRMELIA